MTAQVQTATRTIRLNGETRQVREGLTVAGLLDDLDLDPRMVVVERNRAILRDRATLAAAGLEEGDVIEIVHFVGGG